MPSFDYTAYSREGRKITGMIDADSIASARQKLRSRQLFPLRLDAIESERLSSKALSHRVFGKVLTPRIKRSETSMVTRQLATLLGAGFPLVSAVSTLTAQTPSRAFQKVLSKIKESLEEGSGFADALSEFPSVFSNVYVNMIRAGESSGTLGIVLERLADISEKREETTKKIQASLAYPALMALIGCGVVFFLLTYIVPNIVSIFSDLEQSLPRPTLWLLAVSGFMKNYWWAVLGLALFLVFLYLWLSRTRKGGYMIDAALLRLPYLGNLVRKLAVARFTRVLGSLIQNGIPLLTALHIAKATAGNQVILKGVEHAVKQVEQGGELAKALEEHRSFPSLAVQMIKVGEKSGSLETMLEKTADLYDREVQSSVAAVTAVVEPVIILFMGVIVGFIVLSIVLPLVEMNQLVR